MEHLNLLLFNELNAGNHLHGYPLWLSVIAAKYLVFFVVLWLFGIWLIGAQRYRRTLVFALSASLIALFINWAISLIWFHPHPFMLGIGHTYLKHAPDSTFPSDHITALCAIFFVFLWKETIRNGVVMVLMFATLIVAWARIYVGVHYPLDMLGGVIVAALSTIIIIYLSPLINRYLVPISEGTYRKLFGHIIQNEK